jgi:hypothetical protein
MPIISPSGQPSALIFRHGRVHAAVAHRQPV